MGQPIIRGIQAVGAVDIIYKYNSADGKLALNNDVMRINGKTGQYIETAAGVPVAGFRLDGEFLRAVQQIASSVQVPILGGGAVALTNNNRSGTLNINCTKVSTPAEGTTYTEDVKDENGNVIHKAGDLIAEATGAMLHGNGLGPVNADAYDLVFIAQVQQAQPGGDSVGATITVDFMFCGLHTTIAFQGCTIASVDPVGLAGNDAVNYNVSINYLNWTVNASNANGEPIIN
jgi:hypothetical protein